MIQACERSWEVEALREGRLSAGDADSFARHEEHCAECRERSADLEKLRALGCALPVSTIDLVGARRLRQAILRAAALSDWRDVRNAYEAFRSPRTFAIAVAAVVIAAIVVWSRYDEVPSKQGDSAPAVLPVRDSSSKERGSREAIDVLVTTVPVASPRARAVSVNRSRAERVDDTTPAPSLNEVADYEIAVELFTARRYDEAARALHAFSIAHAERLEAEDAAFLEANALARVGRADAAAVVAERFLDRYPASLHAPDAALLAVRAARDRHDCTRARALAKRWIAEEGTRRASLAVCAEL